MRLSENLCRRLTKVYDLRLNGASLIRVLQRVEIDRTFVC